MGANNGKQIVEKPPKPDPTPAPPKINKKELAESYIEAHPDFLSDYILRNIELLDKFVASRITREKLLEWLESKPGSDKPKPKIYLKYLSCDYLKKANMTSHMTSEYQHKDLIVRRAGSFKLKLNFKNRLYDVKKDDIILELKIGKHSSEIDGTKQRMHIAANDVSTSSKRWSCVISGRDETTNSMEVQVHVPFNAIVGRYRVLIEVKSEREEGEKSVKTYTLPDVIILFNPFSSADDVYMEDEADRKEYVMNEQGLLWAGNTRRQSKFNWTYGQFEPDVLDIALRLLNEHNGAKINPTKSLKKRNSPVFCARVLSAMVNVNNDDGVLQGRWDGKYTDGASPSSWNSSVKILRQWNDTGEGVKYGQCWVFAAVLNTVLRAIGIPSRPVTNFNSAHDTEYNMTIDKFYYEDGRPSDVDRSGDSVWNFHVWNDCWMKRKDLGSEYDGWQSLDATPQEPSSGIYQCGPAPLTAIKRGEVNLNFDTDFLFGEVNADMCYWLVDENDKIVKKINQRTRHIGQLISTKMPGSRKRLDVTDQYKYEEGTKEERESFERARLRGRIPDWHEHYLVQPEGDVTIDINALQRKIRTGADVKFDVKVKNLTTEDKKCIITSRIESMYYSGKRYHGVKEISTTITIAASSQADDDLSISADFSEYGHLLSDDLILRCVTSVRVMTSDEFYLDEDYVTMKHPKCIQFTPPEESVQVGKSFDLKYKITNPFPMLLRHLVMTLEGVGVDETFMLHDVIKVGGVLEGVVHVQAKRRGRVLIAANVHSKEVSNIKRKTWIDVQ